MQEHNHRNNYRIVRLVFPGWEVVSACPCIHLVVYLCLFHKLRPFCHTSGSWSSDHIVKTSLSDHAKIHPAYHIVMKSLTKEEEINCIG